MSDTARIELLPLGKTLQIERGTPLQDLLFAHGVEFPCGGRGRCKGCKMKLLDGALPVTADEESRLSSEELRAGWRLSCQHSADGDLKIEVAQWEAAILADDSVFEFTQQEGLGIAIDLGTTTVVAQLLDLRTGRVLAVRTAVNPQARHGGDVMSRIEFAISGGRARLTEIIREKNAELIDELFAASDADRAELRRMCLVGNTVMHNLFCGIDVEPLSRVPFEPKDGGLQTFSGRELGWEIPDRTRIEFLPCMGSFVGSDILAGVLATKLHESSSLAALIDLGTNGEIVVGTRERLLCASTAAGPAFEGARISSGMRAATGAISEVRIRDGKFSAHVIGNVAPRGICGSGLVDAVAAALDLGCLDNSGRLADGEALSVLPPISLMQADIRELQLAKGAIAAGVEILVRQWGARVDQVEQVFLAGAFGNYINYSSARRIGLLKFPAEKIQPVGNSALLGCKLALFNTRADEFYRSILNRIRHVSLNDDQAFQEIFISELDFP